MKILVCHNSYREPGGEDVVFHREAELLKRKGHDVRSYHVDNVAPGMSSTLSAGLQSVWSFRTKSALGALLRDFQPDVAHFHNIFPLISPSAYAACRTAGVAVVQTLHNYRLGCINGYLYREGHRCEICVGRRVPLAGVLGRCYKGSVTASVAAAAVGAAHAFAGTWSKYVDAFIAPSGFARTKAVAAGLPPERVVVKPHFVEPAPEPGGHDGCFGLYVGRLSHEKGLHTLVEAAGVIGSGIQLKIAGSGPLEHLKATAPASVQWLGHLPHQRVIELMQDAAYLVFPSEVYETFGLSIVEAFSTGLPVICATGGAPEELVRDGETGLHFEAGNAQLLAERIDWAQQHPDALRQMGINARLEFQARYTADRNYDLLCAIYARVLRPATNVEC
jgi:glycosyltransferase involved in cell wall biosynthesis